MIMVGAGKSFVGDGEEAHIICVTAFSNFFSKWVGPPFK